MTAPISGIIHTKNEERFVGQAIRSLSPVVDEIIVADMASTDGTRDIARESGATLVDVPDYGYLEPALKHSHDAARFEWVLRIDADEIVPPELGAQLRAIVASDQVDVVSIPRRNYFFGTPLESAGWFPDPQRRLYRKDLLRAGPIAIHGSFLDDHDARLLELDPGRDAAIVHFNYVDWHAFVDRMNHYTEIEAHEVIGRGGPASVKRETWEVLRTEIIGRGLRHGGLRGGSRGFALVLLMVTYRMLVRVKAQQLAEVGSAEQIVERYREEARRIMGW